VYSAFFLARELAGIALTSKLKMSVNRTDSSNIPVDGLLPVLVVRVIIYVCVRA
jgi:hypothetical protein